MNVIVLVNNSKSTYLSYYLPTSVTKLYRKIFFSITLNLTSKKKKKEKQIL